MNKTIEELEKKIKQNDDDKAAQQKAQKQAEEAQKAQKQAEEKLKNDKNIIKQNMQKLLEIEEIENIIDEKDLNNFNLKQLTVFFDLMNKYTNFKGLNETIEACKALEYIKYIDFNSLQKQLISTKEKFPNNFVQLLKLFYSYYTDECMNKINYDQVVKIGNIKKILLGIRKQILDDDTIQNVNQIWFEKNIDLINKELDTVFGSVFLHNIKPLLESIIKYRQMNKSNDDAEAKRTIKVAKSLIKIARSLINEN